MLTEYRRIPAVATGEAACLLAGLRESPEWVTKAMVEVEDVAAGSHGKFVTLTGPFHGAPTVTTRWRCGVWSTFPDVTMVHLFSWGSAHGSDSPDDSKLAHLVPPKPILAR